MSETVAAGCWYSVEGSCPTEESSTIVSWRLRIVVLGLRTHKGTDEGYELVAQSC